MGVPSPKSDIDGSQVSEVYWVNGELERIKEYCERDVAATANACISISGNPISVPENIVSV